MGKPVPRGFCISGLDLSENKRGKRAGFWYFVWKTMDFRQKYRKKAILHFDGSYGKIYTYYMTDGSGVNHMKCNIMSPTVWANKKLPGGVGFFFFESCFQRKRQ